MESLRVDLAGKSFYVRDLKPVRAGLGKAPAAFPLVIVQRLFFSDTYEVDVDGSGRILIPDVLRTAAGLARELVFLGAGDRIEIWDAERWKARKAKIAGGYAKIASEIF